MTFTSVYWEHEAPFYWYNKQTFYNKEQTKIKQSHLYYEWVQWIVRTADNTSCVVTAKSLYNCVRAFSQPLLSICNLAYKKTVRNL